MMETRVKEIPSEFQTKLKAELKSLVEIQKVERWLFVTGRIQVPGWNILPVVPGCCIICDVGGGGTGKVDWAWATGTPLIIKNEMQISKKRNIIFENIALGPNLLGMNIL